VLSRDLDRRGIFPPIDGRYLEFADDFEQRFVNQGAERRSITATLELAWDLLDAAVHLGEHARIGPAGMAKQGLRHGVLLLTRRALRMIGPGLRLPRPLLAHVQLEERPVRETKPAQRAGSGKGGGHVVLLRLAAEMRSPQLTGGYMSNGSRPGWTGHAIPVVARWR